MATSAHRRNRAAVAEREARIIQWVAEGLTQTEIARREGITQQRASQIWTRALNRLPVANANEYRRNELELIGTAIRELFEIARNPKADAKVRVEAYNSICKWDERRAKVLGTDALIKREITVLTEDRVDAAISELRGQMALRAREAGVEMPALPAFAEVLSVRSERAE